MFVKTVTSQIILMCCDIVLEVNNWQCWHLLRWHFITSISDGAARHHFSSQAAELTDTHLTCQSRRDRSVVRTQV